MAQHRPVKVGVRKSGQAGKDLGSLRPERRGEAALEPKEADIRRAGRKGKTVEKGRHKPSRKVAIKGLEEARKAEVKREMRRRSRVSSRPGGQASGPGQG